VIVPGRSGKAERSAGSGTTLRLLLLLTSFVAFGTACPKQKLPEPTRPAAAQHDVDSNDPADPKGACPPGSGTDDDGCPDVDAGLKAQGDRGSSPAR